MHIVVAYSSKAGLLEEYRRRYGRDIPESDIPPDVFAEGDTPETIAAVRAALESAGRRTTGLEADEALPGALAKLRPDLVFNMAEGLWGDLRESYVPLVCERMGLPYTGSDGLTLALCLNKARTKEFLAYHRVPTPTFRLYHPGIPARVNGASLPAIVKPTSEGSSKGIFDDSVVETPEAAEARIREKLDRYNQPVLLEQFLDGPEFTVAVWGNGPEAEALPLVGIDYARLPAGARPIYSYEAKWIWDTRQDPLAIFQCPAPVSPRLARAVAKVALAAYRALGVRDWCRVDVRCDREERPFVLELNPLPGILPDPADNSCFPKAARTAGYDFPAMVNRVVDIAARRWGISPTGVGVESPAVFERNAPSLPPMRSEFPPVPNRLESPLPGIRPATAPTGGAA